MNMHIMPCMKIANDEEFAKALTERIASLRRLQGQTQKQVADKLGISQQAFARYEAGVRRIPTSILPVLAEALGTSVEELLGVQTNSRKRGKTSQLEHRFQLIRSLSPKERRYIVETLDRLLGVAS